jgi:hypothetical protein
VQAVSVEQAPQKTQWVAHCFGWLLVLAINEMTFGEFTEKTTQAGAQPKASNSMAVIWAFLIWRVVALFGLLRYSLMPGLHHQFVFVRSCVGGLALPLFALGLADNSQQITNLITTNVPSLYWGRFTLPLVASAFLVGLYTISHNNVLSRTGIFVTTYGLMVYLAASLQSGPAYCSVLVLMFSQLFLPVDGDSIMNIPASVWTHTVNAIAVLGIVLAFVPLF